MPAWRVPLSQNRWRALPPLNHFLLSQTFHGYSYSIIKHFLIILYQSCWRLATRVCCRVPCLRTPGDLVWHLSFHYHHAPT